MRVSLKFFASIRERLGAGEQIEVPEGSTVGTVRDLLLRRSNLHVEMLARNRAVRAALNQKMCAESAVLADGDELAFFPPVTGG